MNLSRGLLENVNLRVWIVHSSFSVLNKFNNTLYQNEVREEGFLWDIIWKNVTRLYFIINFFKSLPFVPDV